MYHDHQYCRACGYARPGAQGTKSGAASEKLLMVFDLGVQPLANDFCKQGDEHAGYAPLRVLLCPRCHLAQLSAVVEPAILYAKNYAYVTSTSAMMRQHFEALARDIAHIVTPFSVLEIGSNDGLLLDFLKKSWGISSVLGVDPAPNLGEKARKLGVETVTGFWGKGLAETLRLVIEPNVIMARHVFCHCPDWRDFIAGLELVTNEDTLICLETPYVQDLLDRGEFDTIYHEHLSYLSIKSIMALLHGTGLQLYAVKRYPIHGGAVMLFIRKRNSFPEVDNSVQQFLDAEDVGQERWVSFSRKATNLIEDLRLKVVELRKNGKTVAALGASAKLTVLCNAAGFSRKDLAFVADTTMGKWYTTVPGTDIPVTDEGAILRELPDYVLCGAWNYREEILQKNEVARNQGTQFIFHVPNLEIV